MRKAIVALAVALLGLFGLATAPNASASNVIYHFCYGGNSYVNGCSSYVEHSYYNPPWALPPGSYNNSYTLKFQVDCNLVFYDPGYQNNVSWASNTSNLSRPCTLDFQPDDNMVIYDSSGHPRWATNTAFNDRTAIGFYMDNQGCFWLDHGLTHVWVNHSYCIMAE